MVSEIAVLEEKLEKLIHTLRKNKEQVPLETLMTLYAEPYKALTEHIRMTLTEYIHLIVCSCLPIGIDDQEEAIPIINNTIQQPNIMKFISIATYKSYDLEKVYSLAIILRTLIIRALLPILNRHTYDWLDQDDIRNIGLPYNTLLHCFFIDEAWVMLEHGPGYLTATDEKKED